MKSLNKSVYDQSMTSEMIFIKVNHRQKEKTLATQRFLVMENRGIEPLTSTLPA
jgi:hypothetical protein